MKYFRHAPLAFWSSVVIALAAITLFALSVRPDGVSDIRTPRVGASSVQDLRGPAFALLERVSGSYVSATGGAFLEWSTGTVELARTGAARFAMSGGRPDSTLGLAWTEAVDAALDLASIDPTDTPLLIERTARLNLAAQSVVTLANDPDAANASRRAARSVLVHAESAAPTSTTQAPPVPEEDR